MFIYLVMKWLNLQNVQQNYLYKQVFGLLIRREPSSEPARNAFH
jgi:hypothetical protein